MNALYRESPAVDRSALANSASQLDLSVLNCSQVGSIMSCLRVHFRYYCNVVDYG